MLDVEGNWSAFDLIEGFWADVGKENHLNPAPFPFRNDRRRHQAQFAGS
jgi:hypothetical protein